MMCMFFDIADAVGAIHRAQNRANRLREPQAVITKGGEFVVTPYRRGLEPLEICWPAEKVYDDDQS